MPFGIGFFATAGVSAPAGSFDLLETTVLSSAQASVEFINLGTKYAADYQHLQIRAATRTDSGGAADVLTMTFNGIGGTSYASHLLFGNGSTVVSSAEVTSGAFLQWSRSTGAGSAANMFSAAVADILDPFETTKNTTVRALSGQPDRIELYSGVFLNTAAVSSITLDQRFGSNFITGSRFSLYGIRKG